MADWVDALGDAVYQVASSIVNDRTPKQIVGIVFGALATFLVIGTIVSLWMGVKLDPVGWFIAVPLLLICATISVYCLLPWRSGS